jgi:methyl-accepting chemotaxis protein
VKWFYNMKTAAKLISAFVVVAMIVGFIGFYGLNNTNKLNVGMSNMYHNNLNPINDLSAAQILYGQMRFNIIFMNTLAAPADRSKNEEALIKLKKQVEERMAAYRHTELNQAAKDVVNRFDPAWQSFNGFLDQCIKTAYAGDLEGYKKISVDFKKAADQLEGVLTELIAINVKLAEQADTNSDTLYASSRTAMIVIVLAALLISIALGYLISQVIARPLNRMLSLVDRVADGDLRETTDIDTKDEIGKLAKSVNNMILKLRATVGGILASAESVAAAAEQISASTQEVASGSTSQAADAQTMNELFKELSAAINSVARNAEQAAEMSNNTMDIAKDGGKVVQSSINGMNLVNQQMARLEDDSQQIGKIIEVIDDIAEQTNLLALNAAIEAARAGDEGRGFAVVADEVRKLAERSSEATKQITAIIKGMQENTQKSVIAVGEGVTSSQKTGEAFEHIITMINESTHKVTEIAAASEEQAAQSSEVLTSIESISASTEEAAASSEETASTAQSLAHLAEELNKSVSIFKIH